MLSSRVLKTIFRLSACAFNLIRNVFVAIQNPLICMIFTWVWNTPSCINCISKQTIPTQENYTNMFTGCSELGLCMLTLLMAGWNVVYRSWDNVDECLTYNRILRPKSCLGRNKLKNQCSWHGSRAVKLHLFITWQQSRLSLTVASWLWLWNSYLHVWRWTH